MPRARMSRAARPPRVRALALALAHVGALWLLGCSLAPPAPDPIFYVAPPLLPLQAREVRPPLGPVVRFAPVRAAAYLGDRIAWRRDEVELGLYDARRWAEPPAALVRRALRVELFSRRGLREAQAGGAPLLECEVTAFDEVLGKPRRARLGLALALYDARAEAQWQHELMLEEAFEGDDPRALARAMGALLAKAQATLGPEVAAALKRLAPPGGAPAR